MPTNQALMGLSNERTNKLTATILRLATKADAKESQLSDAPGDCQQIRRKPKLGTMRDCRARAQRLHQAVTLFA